MLASDGSRTAPGACGTSTSTSSPAPVSPSWGRPDRARRRCFASSQAFSTADEGSVETRGRIGSLLAISVGLESLLTGRENSLLLGVLVGLSIDETRERIDEIKERSRLGDAFERTIHTYSQGMRARLHLSVIQSVSTDVLLLDEIFEALDHEFRKIVEDFARDLRERGGVVVAAGHDHAALQRICPRAMWLAEGRVISEGPFTEVVGDYRGGDTPELA